MPFANVAASSLVFGGLPERGIGGKAGASSKGKWHISKHDTPKIEVKVKKTTPSPRERGGGGGDVVVSTHRGAAVESGGPRRGR